MSEPTEKQWADYIGEAREKLHASPDESDENLKNHITFAYHEIQGWSGRFPLSNKRGRGLVMEYVRFLYNGQGEYFSVAYRDSLANFGWELYQPTEGDK